MLYLKYMNLEDYPEQSELVRHPKVIFKYFGDSKWLEEPIFRRAVQDIEQLEVRSDETVASALKRADLTANELSSGLKSLLIAKHLKEFKTVISRFGNNCLPYLLELAESDDIYVVADMPFGNPVLNKGMELLSPVFIENDGSLAITMRDVIMWNINAKCDIFSKAKEWD